VAVVVFATAGLFASNRLGVSSEMPVRLPLTSDQAASTTRDACQPGHPVFFYGFGELHALLGARMGDPTECEQPIHVNGDTRQKTSTGYAYYRKSDNVPTFTNGWDHWALTPDGLAYWNGDVVDPPTARSTNSVR
jgi:hypothetical protein